MARLNWAQFDGATFESLVHSILFFTEPGIVLFGRPGADRGQDAITGDHSHVYQAKYGRTLTMAAAIRLARDELKEIRNNKNAGGVDYKFWKDVTKWTLVANFEKNADDVKRWESEIVTAFRDLNFEIDFWDATELDNRLLGLQDVEEAYFGGVNRCFLSLWEAGNFLKSGINGKYFFDTALYGRDEQIAKFKQFVEDENARFLFVRGAVSAGKTRFLYEMASIIADDGWRVFWGMPESMAVSDSWMKGVNNNCDKTVLVVDDPRDVNLVQRVYEQLSVRGFRTWKVLFSCCVDCRKDIASRFEDRQDTDCLELTMLGVSDVDKMINDFRAKYSSVMHPAASEELIRLTKGMPGMISLIIGDCLDRKVPLSISVTVLNFAQQYVDHALEVVKEPDKRSVITILRWVCVWRTVVIDNGGELENAILDFLAKETKTDFAYVKSVLDELVDAKLLVLWGKNRKIYTAEPALIRQEVLSEWLLERDEGGYKDTDVGRRFIKRLLSENIPEREKIIENLARLSMSYLAKDQGMSFLSPVFNELAREAVDGDVLTQYAVFEWLKKVAAVDPEAALNILNLILTHPKDSKEIHHQYWGNQIVSHSNILSGVGMFLLELSHVRLSLPATFRLWGMIRQIYDDECRGLFKPKGGEEMTALLQKMLSSWQSSDALQQLSYDTLIEDCKGNSFSEFDKLVALSLLKACRESVIVSRHQILFSHSYIVPGTRLWDRAKDVRAVLFSLVEKNSITDGSELVWEVLAEAHRGWRINEKLDAKAAEDLSASYDPIVMDDLNHTLAILKMRENKIPKQELGAARRLWMADLEYGKTEEERALASACECEYGKYFTWQFQEFFSWDVNEDKLEQQVNAIKEKFTASVNADAIEAFFDDGHEYLCSQDPKHPDADCGRGHDLALKCSGLYFGDDRNAYGAFLEKCWIKSPAENGFMRNFSRCALMFHLRSYRLKHSGVQVVAELKRLLNGSEWREELLVECYQGLTATILGKLNREEFEYFISKEIAFSDFQLLSIIPCFLPECFEDIKSVSEEIFCRRREESEELNELWRHFLVCCYLVVLRSKDVSGCPNPIAWLMRTFVEYDINGAYLESRELRYLAKESCFRFSQEDFVGLLKRRIEIEKNGKQFEAFQVMPFQFDVGKWVSTEFDIDAIQKLCRMSVEGKSYTAAYMIPEYLAVLDKDGKAVAAYVKDRLDSGEVFKEDSLELYALGGLASQYGSDLEEPWIRIVSPICQYMLEHRFSQKSRNKIYCGFQKKMKTWSCGIGEVPSIFTDRVAEARRASDECIGGLWLEDYRKWALRVAEWELKSAQEQAEEDCHE